MYQGLLAYGLLYHHCRSRKETSMNPLVNTDLHTYLRRLVDQHLPNREGDEPDRSEDLNLSLRRSDKDCPAVEEKGTKP